MGIVVFLSMGDTGVLEKIF